MGSGRKTYSIVLTEEQQEQLETFANSRTLAHAQVVRARIVLMAAEGKRTTDIAAAVGVTRATVTKWRARFIEYGLDGLYDEVRPGRPRTIEEETVVELINKTLQSTPDGATHWTCRTMAEETGVSKSTVQRIWNTFAIQPHRRETFKLSSDPFFVEKVRDIVGLYLNPPENAVVLCVDEKSQCQALERSQPMLPMGLGYVEGVTHDYVRHGTTTLFAALDIANGKVLHQCNRQRRNQEFVQFLRVIDRNVPQELELHIIIDNYSTHKHAKVRAWLASHPRFHFHFTPTYSSWLNQVERWFGLITDRAIRRGLFSSVKQLKEKIDNFVAAYNKTATPFVWTATAESFFEKISRLCERISGTGH